MRKITLLAVLFCLPLFLIAQEETEPKYTMYQDVHIKPIKGHNKDFIKATKAHNEKYHNADPHKAQLFRIATGTDSGYFVWEMGPCTFTDLDSRPSSENGHDDDWDTNVGAHIDHVRTVEYWKLSEKISNIIDDEEEHSKYEVWYFDIEDGGWPSFTSFMEKVKTVNAKMGDEFTVWTNRFSQNDGRQVCLFFGFNNWADLDTDDWNMKKEYETEFGADTWAKALEEWQASTTPMVREVWVKE